MEMLKNYSALEHKVENRTYTFLWDHASPIGEIYDTLQRMQYFVSQQIASIEKAKKEQAENKKEEACCASEGCTNSQN